MSKKSIIAVLSAVVLMVVASLALVFTVGPMASAADETVYTVPVKYLSINDGVLGDGSTGGAFNANGKTWIQNHAKYCVKIPESVISIGHGAFRGCSGLTSITIPEGVTSIGNSAFYNCSGLTSITIPEGVTSIGVYAFEGCSGLTSITIPAGVASIGSGAFNKCSGLTSMTVDPNNNTYTSRDGNNNECNCIIEKSSNKLLCGCQSTIIPEGVTSIGSYAFYECSGLTSITIPEGVTSIGSKAFYGCSGLTSITIPNSVTTIGYDAFYNCSGLTSITIPENVTSIGYDAFYGCSGLTGSITIPASVTSIGNYAFYNCSGLTSITIPNSVTSIGDCAFRGCSGLTNITIPESVTSIGNGAFNGCSGLTSITVDPSNTKYTSQDNEGHECNCIIEKSSNKLLCGCQSTIIPEGVTSIGNSAFYNRSGLTSITIPEGVTSIGGSAFEGCSGLTSITIPNSVTSIDGYTFKGCSSLTSITIPEGVTRIGEQVFVRCSGLTSVTFAENSQLTSIGINAFNGCSGLTSITIPESMIHIGQYAFYGCSGLTSITIPERVTSIDYGAFSGCYGLKEIVVRNPDLMTNTELQGYPSILHYGAEQNTVKFVTNCDTTIDDRLINFGEVTTEPTSLTKEYYTFAGWYLDERYSKPFTFDTPIKYDITLYAKWEENPTVTFMVDGAEYSSETIEYNTAVTAPTEPTKTGYTFMGWYRNNAAYDFNTLVTENITLTAKWNINRYMVDFYGQGTPVDSVFVNHGDLVAEPTISRKGYTLLGWFVDDEIDQKFNFNTPITDNIGLWAKWSINQYNVIFDSDGGNAVAPQRNVEYNTLLTVPETPTREGYNFLGWYNGDEVYDFTTPVSEDMTLTAKWESNQPDEPETPDEETSTEVNNQNNNGLLWGILGTSGGILLVGGIVFGIVISKRRRK